MECCDQMPALFDQYRVTLILCQNTYAGAGAPDDGRADEDRFHVSRARSLLKIGGRLDVRDLAVDLSPVGITLDSEVDGAKAFLRRVAHFLRQKNSSRAGSEDWLLTRELTQRFVEIHEVDELEHGGALAAWYHQAVDVLQLRCGADEDRLGARAFERLRVRFEVALQRENPDPFHRLPIRWTCGDSCVSATSKPTRLSPRVRYQPRVCINSPSGSLEMSSPGIAIPRSSLASSNFSGSLKKVVALTIALARASGSSLLKIPEPTKTASAPSCSTRAASAGVAMPPAEKFGTGSLPCSATHSTSSSGAPRFLASCTSSSLPRMVRCRISLTMVRMWRTASTMLPEPASPLVRIMAAPSAMRRRASPRLRAPHTKGTLKPRLAMWCSSSAGVRTSLSSM